MIRFLLAGIGCMAASAVYADSTLLWQGRQHSGTIFSGAGMVPTSRCYPTMRRLTDGTLIYHAAECREKAHNHLDLGVPLRGPVINMSGVREATRVKVTKDRIILY